MKISQLYTYPIKSLRPTTLTEAVVTRKGFPYDRRFMLLKIQRSDDDTTETLKNMHVSNFPEMTLFLTDMVFPSDDNKTPGKIIVTYRPPSSEKTTHQGSKTERTLEVPLQPRVERLKEFDIVMHQSATTGYDMGGEYNDWFSECFGYRVVLAYLGDHSRRVLGTFAPSLSPAHKPDGGGAFFGGLLSKVTAGRSSILPGYFGSGGSEDDENIAFADCAPYLIVSQTSLDDVAERLGTGADEKKKMDVTKFRPNIVISGAKTAFEEDFWGEVLVGGDEEEEEEGTRLLLTANCVRCKSINIDYATGKPGTGESGSVLKKLMKDRRVDKGAKYSPVFGRYAFLAKGSEDRASLHVGDEVVVSKVIPERTIYDWPGLGN